MPYTPRPTTTLVCPHCGQEFAARHARRLYCTNSCNVLATYARNGRRRDTSRPVTGVLGRCPDEARRPADGLACPPGPPSQLPPAARFASRRPTSLGPPGALEMVCCFACLLLVAHQRPSVGHRPPRR